MSLYFNIKNAIIVSFWKCSFPRLQSVIHPKVSEKSTHSPKLGLLSWDTVDAPERMKFIQYEEMCDSSGVCMYSFVSYTEYAMSFTDFLLAHLLWSNPAAMPL